MDQFHDPKQQKNTHKPMFDAVEPSMFRAQLIAKRDISFSSYLHQPQNHQNKYTPQIGQNRREYSDQISIFDASKYFSSLEDDLKDQQPSKGVNHLAPIPPRLSSVSSFIDDNGSNYAGQSSICSSNNYRARSFHATPTASSEASWNSQTGLLANPPGSIGVNITKSPNSCTSTTSNAAPSWPRISTKWLIPRRKCPCMGKKSVQVEERIEYNTPRMVDLRRSFSSNGSSTNYISSSWYSPRKSSPNIVGTITYTTIPLTSPNEKNHHHPNGGFSSVDSNPKMMGPLKSFTNHSKIIDTTATTATTAAATTAATTGSANGFRFPILENRAVGVKKMFNVIADRPRKSLEVFQPGSHSISPKSRRPSYEDDNVLSDDGSSDLFEIESFSTTTYPCRDSLDEVVVPASIFNSSSMKRLGIVYRSNNNNVDDNDSMDEPMTPSVAPTECYAPSEVSIDWSVTTAETNFSVSASEIGSYAAMRRESERNYGGRGGNGGGLLSCRCEKAVSVGPVPIKCSAEGEPPITARHVSGRPMQQPHGVAAHVNGRRK